MHFRRWKWRISLVGSVAAAWPLAAQPQSTIQPSQAMTGNVPHIEVALVTPVNPTSPILRFQFNDGAVDLMMGFSLNGFEGVGSAWKIPPTDATFDARYGRW
jgi:hypothetical protein